MTNEDHGETVIEATGNGMKTHDRYDTFLEVTGGSGNRQAPEVHLLMRSNDGEFSQGWFYIYELRDAIRKAEAYSE